MPHIYTLPWAPYISIIRSRMKKGKSNASVRIIHIERFERIKWGAKQGLFWKFIEKIPSYLTWGVEVIWFKIVPFLNYPQWHDRHFQVHKSKVWFGISLMLTSYHRNFFLTLALNLYSRTSKGPSVGEFVDGPYNKYLTAIISRMRGGYNKLHAHFK
jgi:hypothetical protein